MLKLIFMLLALTMGFLIGAGYLILSILSILILNPIGIAVVVILLIIIIANKD